MRRSRKEEGGQGVGAEASVAAQAAREEDKKKRKKTRLKLSKSRQQKPAWSPYPRFCTCLSWSLASTCAMNTQLWIWRLDRLQQ